MSASDLAELMVVELKASKPKTTDIVPPRAKESLEGRSDDVPKPVDGQNISRFKGRSVDALGEPSSKALRRQKKASIDPARVVDVGNLRRA